MDERRFRLYVSIIIGLFAFTGVRVLTETNPIYSFGEPVFSWLNDFSSEVALVDSSQDDPSSAVEAQNDLLSEENERLREELGLKTELQALSAEVTRRDLQTFRKFVWVNVGSDDGVVRGQTVLHRDSLFGVVDEVYETSSVIKTVLDPEFRATVVLGSEQGILKVDYGSLLVDLVPSKSLSSSAIVTDGLDSVIESGISVGRADQLTSDDADVFGSYNVLLPYSLFDVQFVDILPSSEVEL